MAPGGPLVRVPPRGAGRRGGRGLTAGPGEGHGPPLRMTCTAGKAGQRSMDSTPTKRKAEVDAGRREICVVLRSAVAYFGARGPLIFLGTHHVAPVRPRIHSEGSIDHDEHQRQLGPPRPGYAEVAYRKPGMSDTSADNHVHHLQGNRSRSCHRATWRDGTVPGRPRLHPLQGVPHTQYLGSQQSPWDPSIPRAFPDSPVTQKSPWNP